MKVVLFSWNNRFPAANGSAFRSLEAARSLVRISDLDVVTIRQPEDDGPDAFERGVEVDNLYDLGACRSISGYTVAALRRGVLPHVLLTREVVDSRLDVITNAVQGADLLVLDRPYWLGTAIADLPVAKFLLQSDAELTYYRDYAAQTKARRRLQALTLHYLAQRTMVDLYSRSDRIIAISESDRTATMKHTSVPVTLVPSSVERDDWELPPNNVEVFRPRIAFLGTDEPRNVWAVRWYCDEVLPSLDETYSNLTVVGRFSPEVARQFDGLPVEFTGWVDDVRNHLFLGDIMIAPYVSNNGLKAKVLHSLAMGLPVVATTPVADSLISTDGVIVADTSDEFNRAFAELSHEDNYRKYRDLAIRNVEANYSLEAVTERWSQVLQTASTTG